MMDLIIDTVKKLESMMKDSGCEDSGVVLDVNAIRYLVSSNAVHV